MESFRAALCARHWRTHGVDGVDQLAGLAELHETLPQVVEGPLHQNLLLLVVVEQVVPQRLLGEGFRVAHDDHAVPAGRDVLSMSRKKHRATEGHVCSAASRVSPGSGERHIKTPGVVEEADALVLIGPHARQDDEVLLSALEGVHAGYFHLLYKTHKKKTMWKMCYLIKINTQNSQRRTKGNFYS